MADASDLTLDSVLIEGGSLKAELGSAFTDAKLTRTIDSSPTLVLTVEDQDRTLLRQGFFGQRLTVQVNDYSFEIAALSKKGSTLTITLEDLAVAELRRHNSLRKAKPGTISRVDFIRQILYDETRWIQLFVDPSVHEPVAKIELARGTVSTSTSDASPDPNYFSSGTPAATTTPTVTGALSAAQIAGAAAAAGFKGNNLVIAIAVSLAESSGNASATHKNSNGSTDYGLWQINSVHAALLAQYNWQDPLSNAKMAYSISGGTNWKPWSTYNSGAYKSHMAAAQAASGQPATDYGAATGTSTSSTTGSVTLEDSWTCFKRLFAEVNWRLYADKGNLYAGPDSAFLGNAPAFILREHEGGVDDIDFDWDVGKPIATCKIGVRASRWVAPPGTPVQIPNLGLPDKWIVSSITRSLTSVVTDVTVKAPEPELPEPDPPADAGSIDAGYFGDQSGAAGSTGGGIGAGQYTWPVNGTHPITSPFGQRARDFHDGIDIGVPQGTAVLCSRGGVVTFAGSQSGYGNVVYVVCDDGVVDGPVLNRGDETRYGHLSQISVRRGLRVVRGTLIGLSGGTPGTPGAGDATGPHLHFEIRRNGKAIDPQPLLSSAASQAYSASVTPYGGGQTGGSGASGSW